MPNITNASIITSTAQLGDGVIVNADINASAAIAQSKLNLSITNAEVNASAAIVDTKLAQITTAGKVSGAALTSLASIPAGAGVIPSANLSAVKTIKCGQVNKNAADASTTQNIAHGLGTTPLFVRITAYNVRGSTTETLHAATAVYDGTTMAAISHYTTGNFSDNVQATFTLNTALNTGTQTGVITFDATNIIITWTKTGSPTGDHFMVWEAFG